MPRILIGALSGWNMEDRRAVQGDLDGRRQRFGLDAMFLMADPRTPQGTRRDGDTLYLPCPDDYNTLPQRTWQWCRWAIGLPSTSGRGAEGEIAGDWDYLFKCDDDTYISIPRLAAYDPAGRDYIGTEWRPGVRYASGGAGYFLSRNAAAIVAQRLGSHPTGAEDLLVGQALREAGILLSIDARFVPYGSPEHRPRPDNDHITLHGVEAAVFLAAHAEVGL